MALMPSVAFSTTCRYCSSERRSASSARRRSVTSVTSPSDAGLEPGLDRLAARTGGVARGGLWRVLGMEDIVDAEPDDLGRRAPAQDADGAIREDEARTLHDGNAFVGKLDERAETMFGIDCLHGRAPPPDRKRIVSPAPA